MAMTVAAMKGKLGSTEYFIIAMKAKELVDKAIIPSEIDGWDNMDLEEKEQRDINYTRVRNHIAPYLAQDKDRFFGALIMMVRGLKPDNFEPIADIATRGLPKLYKNQAQLMGFLTLDGDEQLIPLDGQHRLKAIQFAIEGRDEKSRIVQHFKPCSDLASEDVTVILVPYSRKKARKIFTKVNKYAKATTAGQNLVTDDDDVIAVLSRNIANDQNIIGARLVKYKSNTLSDKECYFTTLATLAECNRAILEATFPEKIDPTCLPDHQVQTLYENKVRDVWEFLAEHIDLFSDLLEDKDEGGDAKRKEIRAHYLLGKPVAQVCLVKSFVRLTAPETNLSYAVAAEKLNAINWEKSASEWDRLLMSGGRMQTKNKNLVTDIICYRAGQKLAIEKEVELLEKYRTLFPPEERKEKQLPSLIK